jgi:hypothetical protein
LYIPLTLVNISVGSQNVNMTEEEEEVDMESILCPPGNMVNLKSPVMSKNELLISSVGTHK